MTARATAELPISADAAWGLVMKTATQLYLSRGFFSYSDELPEHREEGFEMETRLKLFGKLPVWKHWQRFERVDHERREQLIDERGAPYRRWEHWMRVEPRDGGCLYVDQFDVDAGVFTPVVWLFARRLAEARVRRFRELAQVLA
jgi:hypothetical protein